MPLRLILRNLAAHKLRALLTFGSVAVAVLLLCVLRAAVVGLSSTVEQAASNRLWVQSAVSLWVDLPIAYEAKIAAVDGVDCVTEFQWFGAHYREKENVFAQFGVDPATLRKTHPEIEIREGSFDAFARNRVGCLIGADLASKYDWKLGDDIPLIGTFFGRVDDSAWHFTVEGIYESRSAVVDQQTLFFDFGYLRESIEQGAAFGPDGVGVYVIRLRPNASATQVMAGVDALFENGPQRVQTTTEAEFHRQFISMMGNVPALLSGIGAAVLFAIFFAVLNTMLMARRERVRSIGIMKALGFTDGAVLGTLVLESILLCGAAGLLGAGLALATERWMQTMIAGHLPGFEIGAPTMLIGIAIALGIGLIAGLVPGWLAGRTPPVRALRAEA